MRKLNNTFMITGMGRTGTLFLSEMLNKSSQGIVTHEWHLPGYRDTKRKHFPRNRFKIMSKLVFLKGKSIYGEVNPTLLNSIDPDNPGPEELIPRKALIWRDPRKVITSSLNRKKRTINDFQSIAIEVLIDFRKILVLQQTNKYKLFEFERFVADQKIIQEIAKWAGLSDIHNTDFNTNEQINKNKVFWFPKPENWEEKFKKNYEELYNQIVGSEYTEFRFKD